MSHAHAVSLAATLERRFRWSQNDVLLISDGQRYTGRDLESLVRLVAKTFLDIGIRPGDVVGMIGENTARFYIAYMAVHRIGAVACALHARESVQRISAAMTHVGCKLVVTDSETLPLVERVNLLRETPIQVFFLDDEGAPSGAVTYASCLERPDTPLALPKISSDDPAIILLSSGSTGTPKAVLHSQYSLLNQWNNARQLYNTLNSQTCFLQMMGTSFAAWAYTGMPVINAGGTIVTGRRFNAEEFCRLVQSENVNVVGAVPTMLRMIDDSIAQRYDLSSLRTVAMSGEVVQERDVKQALKWSPHARVQVFYTTSEMGPTCTTLCSHEDMVERGKIGSVGRPVPNADLRIIDPAGGIDDEVPVGVIGEIITTGPAYASGYFGDDARTAEKFVGGWWRSGDLGQLDEDGFLFFKGRADNTINTGGIKVQGEGIEETLMLHPLVRQAAVVGVPDAKWGNAIAALVVTTEPVTEEELLRFCEAEGLESFKRPKRIHFSKELPLGPTGKLNRGAVKRELSESQD